MNSPASHPILSCAETRALESRLFSGDETKEWGAMQQAGQAIADAVLADFEEIGGFPNAGKILVLVGKGHNGGDALIAATRILGRFPAARAEVVFVFGERALRPLAMRAWQELTTVGRDRWARRDFEGQAQRGCAVAYDLALDGIFGFQFRAPAEPRVTELIERVNGLPVRLRAAVDLPSAGLFRADFTYATGSVKLPAVDAPAAGRIRYLDLGFFDGGETGAQRVLTPAVLDPLKRLRASGCDKRTHGHLFVVGGSRNMPGAVLMTVLAALRSGAGLVTAFVPEPVAATFAARAPEAMWVGWPETPSGGLALEGEHLLRERMSRATALVIGPGIGREPGTIALVRSIVEQSAAPVLIDADAQQPEIVRAGNAARIVTPHAGEFARMAGELSPEDFVRATDAVLVLKGPMTRIVSSAGFQPAPERRSETGATYHSFFGGPVLARGGSGDVLAGLIGGLLAQDPKELLLAAARGVVWHGMAADLLARKHGQVAVRTTQLLDFLPDVLREL